MLVVTIPLVACVYPSSIFLNSDRVVLLDMSKRSDRSLRIILFRFVSLYPAPTEYSLSVVSISWYEEIFKLRYLDLLMRRLRLILLSKRVCSSMRGLKLSIIDTDGMINGMDSSMGPICDVYEPILYWEV